MVCPPQPWLDGINAGENYIRQFVAMPLGEGYAVEGQITGDEVWGGIQISVFEPKPGRFPDVPPEKDTAQMQDYITMAQQPADDSQMGIATGSHDPEDIS